MTEGIQISSPIWAWLKKSVTLSTLSEDIKSNLELWSKGEVQPDFDQLENLSNATKIPFGYFFLNNPPADIYPTIDYKSTDIFMLDEHGRDILEILECTPEIIDTLIEEGKKEATVMVAKNLLRRNLPVESISEDTGLPVDIVKMLQNELKVTIEAD